MERLTALRDRGSGSTKALASEMEALKYRLDEMIKFDKFDPRNVCDFGELDNYHEVTAFRVHLGTIHAIRVLSPDRFLSCGNDGTVKLTTCVPENGWISKTLMSCKSEVTCLQVAPDNTIFAGSKDGSIYVLQQSSAEKWDLAASFKEQVRISCLQLYPGPQLFVGISKEFAKKGTTLISYNKNSKGNWIREELPFQDSINCMQMTAGGRLYTGDERGKIILWKRDQSGEWLQTGIKELKNNVMCLAVRGEKCVVYGDCDGRIGLGLEDENGKWNNLGLPSLGEKTFCLQAVSGDRMVSSGAEGDIDIWQIDNSHKMTWRSRNYPYPYCLHALPGGEIFSGHHDGNVVIWEGEDNEAMEEDLVA